MCEHTTNNLEDKVLTAVEQALRGLYDATSGWHYVRVWPDGRIVTGMEPSKCLPESEYFGNVPHPLTVWEHNVVGGLDIDLEDLPFDLTAAPEDGDIAIVDHDHPYPIVVGDSTYRGRLRDYCRAEELDLTILVRVAHDYSAYIGDGELTPEIEEAVLAELDEWVKNGNYTGQAAPE